MNLHLEEAECITKYQLVDAYCNDRVIFYINKRKTDFRKCKISSHNQENATCSVALNHNRLP